MKEILSKVTFEAQPGELVRLNVSRGGTLASRDGLLWVTRRGDAADYWLAPGDELPLAARDTLYLSVHGALPARLTVARERSRCETLLRRWSLRRCVDRLRGMWGGGRGCVV